MNTETFKAALLREGYEEIFNREYPAGHHAADHSHPFDVRALVLGGEITLKTDGVERAYRAGDVFVMTAGCLHEESVGSQGVRYLVGRRHPK